MDNDEIRLRIAKRLGWGWYRKAAKVCKCGEVIREPGGAMLFQYAQPTDRPDGWEPCEEPPADVVKRELRYAYTPVPNWPADDAAALSLLTGPVVDAGLEWELYSGAELKACCITDGSVFGLFVDGTGPTVAAAICEAVLAWMDKAEGESNMTPPVEGDK